MGKKMKRPSKYQKQKDIKKIKAEMKNNLIFLALAFVACGGLFLYWMDHKENNPTRIALLVACVAFSTGFSRFYTTYVKYKQGLKTLESGKKR